MVDEKVKGFNPLKKGEWDCVCLCVDRLIDLLRERERESERRERENNMIKRDTGCSGKI